jgi:hypothetical protein
MSASAPTRAMLALTAQHRKLGASKTVRGHVDFMELADGKPQVSAEIAEYATSVLGGVAAWMSWQHSRQS